MSDFEVTYVEVTHKEPLTTAHAHHSGRRNVSAR
jgi:hypothetical protein